MFCVIMYFERKYLNEKIIDENLRIVIKFDELYDFNKNKNKIELIIILVLNYIIQLDW